MSFCLKYVVKSLTTLGFPTVRERSLILPGEGGRHLEGGPEFCMLRGRGDENRSILQEGVWSFF